MAVRYSGDVEVRMYWNYKTRTVTGTVTDGRMRYRDVVKMRRPPTPEIYDKIARLLIKRAERRAQSTGRSFPFDEPEGEK